MDGLFAALAVNIAFNNNNLFALKLGAGDYQLSLVQFLGNGKMRGNLHRFNGTNMEYNKTRTKLTF